MNNDEWAKTWQGEHARAFGKPPLWVRLLARLMRRPFALLVGEQSRPGGLLAKNGQGSRAGQ